MAAVIRPSLTETQKRLFEAAGLLMGGLGGEPAWGATGHTDPPAPMPMATHLDANGLVPCRGEQVGRPDSRCATMRTAPIDEAEHDQQWIGSPALPTRFRGLRASRGRRPPGGHADPGMRFASSGANAVTLPTLTAAP